ncbi:MAG: hypothetical protein ACOCV2_13160 [Persicimonas sp.]
MARKSRRRRRRRRSKRGGLIDRAWRWATDPVGIGVLLVLAGLLMALTPLAQMPEMLEASWWETGLGEHTAASVAAGLCAAAVILMGGALWNRYRLATDPQTERRRGSDASFESQAHEPGVRESRLPGLAWLGATCVVVGIGLVLGGWFYGQQSVNPADVALTPGETVESYTVQRGGDQMDVMLPLRLRLEGLETGDDPVARLQLFEAGNQPPEAQPIEPGTGLEVDEYRFTFVGMESHGAGLRAVFESDEPDTIAQTAAEGDTFQLEIDGPEYEVRELDENYQGLMGPAARVRSSKLGDFWVFQEAPEGDDSPDLGHEIQLESLQSQPAAIFAVTKGQPFWPLAAGGSLFVVGLALLIAFPERLVRVDGRRVRVWSFNESGIVAEETLGQIEDSEADEEAT